VTDSGVRLTQLAHGGGCGCKLAPAVLRELLAEQAPLPNSRLLVGNEAGDDAAVWCIDDEYCVLSTTDFFTPIVDDPYDFGRIAAANALSDIYAMGGRPIMALAILGMPIGKLSVEAVREILRGGADVCAVAGIPVAGGHSIDVPEPIYGLAVTGLCKTETVRRNGGAQPGDALLLTKPLGVGIYSAALRKGVLDRAGYASLIATTTLLNSVGPELAMDPGLHAMTDVTGFGLAGHALEMSRASDARIRLDFSSVPLLPEAEALARDGIVTGASLRNWQSYGGSVVLPDDFPDWQRHILTDPQTSGGLLLACEPSATEAIRERITSAGFWQARRIGIVEAGACEVEIAVKTP